jgi:hypothetical protein
MRKQNCCGATRSSASITGQRKVNIAQAGKRALHVLVVLGVIAYTFISRIPVDAFFR